MNECAILLQTKAKLVAMAAEIATILAAIQDLIDEKNCEPEEDPGIS